MSSGCCRLVIVDGAAEREAQEGAFVVGVAPQVDAHERLGMEMPRGFFARLADHGFDQGFTIFEVAGGLVEHQPAGDAFFDHEKTAVALDDRGDGHFGIPAHD